MTVFKDSDISFNVGIYENFLGFLSIQKNTIACKNLNINNFSGYKGNSNYVEDILRFLILIISKRYIQIFKILTFSDNRIQQQMKYLEKSQQS